MAFNKAQAIKFVHSVDLSGTPRGIVKMDAAAAAAEVFDEAKRQAQIVGSGVFSFAQGVTTQVREAISDSALLAQLVANKKVSAEQDPIAWFKAYSDVLTNVGWTVQESAWTDFTIQGTAVEVHEKILQVMTVALGPSPAALAIIVATVDALKAMKSDSPWLTLFNRESQKAKIARFQIGLVEREEGNDVFVSLLCCLVQAHDDIVQILFFKFKDAGATFKGSSAKISINRIALSDLGPAIRTKTRAYQLDYVSSVLNV